MRKLTEMLRGKGNLVAIQAAWSKTEAAKDFGVLPRGEYIADIITGEVREGRENGTISYRLTFKVVEGTHVNARFWHNVWMTEKAIEHAKRDLQKIGVFDLDQLDSPLTKVFRCRVNLELRLVGDRKFNRVRNFTVLEAIDPKPDTFAPRPRDQHQTEKGTSPKAEAKPTAAATPPVNQPKDQSPGPKKRLKLNRNRLNKTIKGQGESK